MWSRRLAKEMAGIEFKDFTKAFLLALKDEEVQKSLCIADLKQEISGLRQTVELFRKELHDKDQKIASLENRIAILETENDNLEQYSRRNSLRITGLVESESEDILSTVLDVINVNTKLTPPIEASDVDRIHRVGKKVPGRSRPTLIKFATYRARKRVMDKRSSFKNSESTTPIFLNEDLTKRRAQLFWKARQLKKEKRIHDAWTYDGNILVKDRNNRIVAIKGPQHLMELEK